MEILPLLPRTTEYGLRVMAYFGGLETGHVLRAKDLAQATNTPEAYVAKVLRQLKKQRLLVSSKGHGGGFSLAMRPEHIRILDVLLALGPIEAANRCAFGFSACDASAPCPLHNSWLELRELVMAWAARTTVADIAAEPAQLTRRG